MSDDKRAESSETPLTDAEFAKLWLLLDRGIAMYLLRDFARDLERRLTIALKELGYTRQEHADIAKFGVQVMLNDLREQLTASQRELAERNADLRAAEKMLREKAAELAALRGELATANAKIERLELQNQDFASMTAELAVYRRLADNLTIANQDAATELASLRQRLANTENLLGRLRQWDMMDKADDGSYWRRQIDAALAQEKQNG